MQAELDGVLAEEQIQMGHAAEFPDAVYAGISAAWYDDARLGEGGTIHAVVLERQGT
jgi:hypothetical protein